MSISAAAVPSAAPKHPTDHSNVYSIEISMPWFFLTLAASILIAPGPTNTLLASSGVQVGIAKSMRLLPAGLLGYGIAVTLWGFLIEVATTSTPWLVPAIKIASAAFILFLAIRLWMTSGKDFELGSTTVSPISVFTATLINPKAILLASAVFPEATWANAVAFTSNMGAFLALALASGLLWVSLGSILASRQSRWLTQGNLQRIACLVLVGFALPIGYSGLVTLNDT